MKIHPLAIVDPRAELGRDVEIGPFCIVEPYAVIGDECRLESRVVVKEGTTLGKDNYVAEGAILGGMPQHLNVPDVPGGVEIGSGNVIRENVTVHRALQEGMATVIGDDNMLMVNVHVAHDCRLGNNIVIANNSMLAGHVTIGDRANLSGGIGVHQFTRIGTLAMVGAVARVMRDIPPFMMVDGQTGLIVGLNRIGLRRAGYGEDEIKTLKKAYRVVFRSDVTWNEIIATLERDFSEGPARLLGPFLSTTTRGIQNDRRASPAIHKIGNDDEGENEQGPQLRIHVG